MADFEIKIFSAEHVPEAAEIERLCFSEPWSENALMYMCSKNPFAVAVIDKASGRLAAYGGVQYVLDEGNIVNIATHPDYRRRGYGKAVVEALIKYAKNNRLDSISLEVRESNRAAIELYSSLGFKTEGKRKDFYTNPREAALVMVLRIK